MGNVNMEASQINYRGGQKKMSVEEALKNTSGELDSLKKGLTKRLTKTVNIGEITYTNGHATFDIQKSALDIPNDVTVANIHGASNSASWADFVVSGFITDPIVYIYLGTTRTDGQYDVGQFTVYIDYI